MIGDLWRLLIGRYGYGTLVWGLVTLYSAMNTVLAFSTPIMMPFLLLTSYLALMTYKRAVKFEARQKAEQVEGALPLPVAPQ